MIRSGFIGWLLSTIIKWSFILIFMFLAMYISYFIGFYDLDGASIDSLVGMDEIAASLISGDYSLSNYEFLGHLGLGGQIIGAFIDTCSKLNTVNNSSPNDMQQIAFNCMSSTIISALVVSAFVKLYTSLARNLNKKFKINTVINFIGDFIYILVTIYISLICAGCINRRVLILTLEIPYMFRFIIYLILLILIATLFAVIDSRLRCKSFFSILINIVCEIVYSILIAILGLTAAAIISLISIFNNTNSFSTEYGILWISLTIVIIAMIVCAYLSNKRKS